jgi:uncharacterized protein
MKINLKQLFNITGESKDIDYSITIEELSDIRGSSFATPVKVKGRIYNKADVVYLDYSAEVTLLNVCDRCLKEFEKTYSFEFSHIVVPSVSRDNDEYIVAEGESIELNDIAVTDILLQLPTKVLCREDCKGLCMVCGCDLNESECNCLK